MQRVHRQIKSCHHADSSRMKGSELWLTFADWWAHRMLIVTLLPIAAFQGDCEHANVVSQFRFYFGSCPEFVPLIIYVLHR